MLDRATLAVAAIFLIQAASATRSVDITVESREATLKGTLLLPEGKGPFPAMVCVHGSGPGVRDGFYRTDAEIFVRAGIATFIYDKRGCGESTGKFDEAAGLGLLVDDALACVAAVRHRPEVNPVKVGLKGISQGGWAVTMAGAKDPSLAFVISVSGPGVNPLDQGIYQRAQILLQEGVPRPVVEKVITLRRLVWRYYATGVGYEQAKAAWDAAKAEPWFVQGKLDPKANVPAPADVAKPAYDFYRNANIDLVPIIASIKSPVLALFGAKDTFIPVVESVSKWEEGIEKGGSANGTIRVFMDAGHGNQQGGYRVWFRLHRRRPREVHAR